MKAKSSVIAKQIKLLFTSILMLGATVVYAEPALIITDFSCTLIDGDGAFFYDGYARITIANNPGGNATMKCRARDASNSTGDTVKWSVEDNPYGSIACVSSDLGESTEDWKITVDPDGNAVMTCKFRN